MGFIRIYEKAGKTKRKPGWQKEAAEYAEWQSKIASMSSGIQTTWKGKALAERKAAKPTPAEVLAPLKAKFVTGGGTKEVQRPEIVYRDNPELLARELAARQRKFNTAPAYNKGAAQFVSEDELQVVLSTNKRR